MSLPLPPSPCPILVDAAARRRHALGLALAIALAGCSRDEEVRQPGPETSRTEVPPEREGPPPREPERGESAPAGPCDTLDRAECLLALHCTMHWIADFKYECRPSEGPCEVDLAQESKRACESREGCAWSPGECYCPFPGYGATQVPDKEPNDGGACACGGGRAPLCSAVP